MRVEHNNIERIVTPADAWMSYHSGLDPFKRFQPVGADKNSVYFSHPDDTELRFRFTRTMSQSDAYDAFIAGYTGRDTKQGLCGLDEPYIQKGRYMRDNVISSLQTEDLDGNACG